MFKYNTFQTAKNKIVDQTVGMRRKAYPILCSYATSCILRTKHMCGEHRMIINVYLLMYALMDLKITLLLFVVFVLLLYFLGVGG